MQYSQKAAQYRAALNRLSLHLPQRHSKMMAGYRFKHNSRTSRKLERSKVSPPRLLLPPLQRSSYISIFSFTCLAAPSVGSGLGDYLKRDEQQRSTDVNCSTPHQ